MNEIISYSSTQLRAMKSETDWNKPVPTDEEIDNASDSEIAIINDEWINSAIIKAFSKKQTDTNKVTQLKL